MALFAPSPSAAPEPLKELQQTGPSSPSAASAKENQDGQVPLSAPGVLNKDLPRRRFSPAGPLAASKRAQPPTARSTVDAGAAAATTAGKESENGFEKARRVLIASNAIEKLAEVVSGKAPINPARRTPLQDVGTAAAASAADAAAAAAEPTGAAEGSGATEGHRRFIPAGPRQGTGGSVFFSQQSPESRTTRRNSYVASTFSSPLLLLSPGASGSGAAGGPSSPPSTRRDNLLEAPADESTRRKALLPSEWGSPVAAAASREPEQTEAAHAAAATAATAAAAAPAAAAAVRRTAAAGTPAAEANANKEATPSVVTAALGGESEPRPDGGGPSPGNAVQAKRRRVGGASFAATAARRFWLSSQQQQQQQQQKPSAEAPPMDTAAQSPAIPTSSHRATASHQRSTAATAAEAAPEAATSASNDLSVEQRGNSASRNHGANSKDTDSSNSGLSLVNSASSNSSFDLRALRRQCYRADAGPLLQSVTSLPSANRRSSRKRRSKSPVAIPSAATSPTLAGVGSSKAPAAAAAAENEKAATATPASGKEQQQQEQQLSPRSRAHQQLSPLLLHGQLLQQEQQLRSPLLLYPPQEQEQQEEEQRQDDEASRREGEVAVGGSHTASASGFSRVAHEGTPGGLGNLLEAPHGDVTSAHADAVSHSPTASEAAHAVAGVLPRRAEVSKAAVVVADAPSTAAAGVALASASALSPAQVATAKLQGVSARPTSLASSKSSEGSVGPRVGVSREEAPMRSHVEAPSQRSPPSARKAAVSSSADTLTVASGAQTELTAAPTRSADIPAAGAARAAAGEGQEMVQRAAPLEPGAPSAAAATAAQARITTSSLSTAAAAQSAAETIAAVSTAATVSTAAAAAPAAATAEAAVLTASLSSAAPEAATTAAAPTPGFPAAHQWPASVDILHEPSGETPRAPPASPSSRVESPTRSIDKLHHQNQQRTQEQQWVRQQQLGQNEAEVRHSGRVETESHGQGQLQQEQLQTQAPAASHQQRLQPQAEDQQQLLQQKRQSQAHLQQQHQSQQQPQEQHQLGQQPQQLHQLEQQPQQRQHQEEQQQQLRLAEEEAAKPRNEDSRSSQLQHLRQQREQQQLIQQQPEQQQPHEQQPQQQPEQQVSHQQMPQQQQPHQLRTQQRQPQRRPSQEDQPLRQEAQHQQPQQQQLHQQRAQQLQPQQGQPHRQQTAQLQPQQQQPQQQQLQQQHSQQQQPQRDQPPRQNLQQQQPEQQQQRLQQREAPQVLQQNVALLRSTPLAEPLAASQPSDLSPRRGHRHSELGAPPPPELAAAHTRQQPSPQQHRSRDQQPQPQQPQQHLQQLTGESTVRQGGGLNLGSLRPVPPPFRPSRLVSPAADGDAIHTQFPLLGHSSSSSNSSSMSTVGSSNSSISTRGSTAARTVDHRADTVEDPTLLCSNDNITAVSSSSASFLAASRNPSDGAQRPVAAPATVDPVRKQQHHQQEQRQQLQRPQHLTSLQEQHELVTSVPSPTSEMRASYGDSPTGHSRLLREGSEGLEAPPVSLVVPDTPGAAAMAADVDFSQARAQQPQQELLVQRVLQEHLVDLEAADSEASPVREGALRQSADSGSFEKALASSDKGLRSGYTQAEEPAPESREEYAGMEAGGQHQLLREVPSLRRGRSPRSSAHKRSRRTSSPPPSPFASTSSSNSNPSSSSPWAAATAAIASKGRRAASAGFRRLYSAARVRLRRLSHGASKWAGALVASALLAAAGPLNRRLVGQLARALPPGFTKLPDFARRELGACEVRRSQGCSRISPRILAGRPTVSEAQRKLREKRPKASSGASSSLPRQVGRSSEQGGLLLLPLDDCCFCMLLRKPLPKERAASAILAMGVRIGEEAEPLDNEGDAANNQGMPGPPFFVEGLRAKPAVDGSLELTDCKLTTTQLHARRAPWQLHKLLTSSSSSRETGETEIRVEAWLTVLGCSEHLRPHHNFFAVDCGGYALTHLRLGIRCPPSTSAVSPGQANAVPRTVVLRLRVYGQVALGPPPPALEMTRGSGQQQQECWPPGVVEDVTNLLHGAAVVVGPSGGVWTPQTKQELLFPGSSLRSRKRTSSRSRDASSRYSSSSSRYSNCSSSVDVGGDERGEYSESRPVCDGPEVWVIRLSSRCCLRRVEFTRQPTFSGNSEEANEGIVYELHGLEAPRELTGLALPQEIREMQELDDLPWQPLARAEFAPDEMHPTLSLAWDDPTCDNAGKPPAVTHVRVVCSRGSDLRRLAMWGIRLPPRAPQGY
ncbi:hypothetical protein Emed_001274 [Eimeria media]